MPYPVIAILAAAAVTLVLATLMASGLMRAGFPVPDETRRLGRIDGLRGYLALFVMLHHFILWIQVTRLGKPWEPPSVALFDRFGSTAVALFFMTTGFVFYPRVLTGLRRTDWRATYISRVFRIYPLLIAAVAVIGLIVLVRLDFRVAAGWRDNALALAQWLVCWNEAPLFGYPDSGRINAYVLWTLWYEWIFYLLLLPASALLRDVIRGRLPTWTIPICLLAASTASSLVLRGDDPLRFVRPFACGMLAFELRLQPAVARLLAGRVAAVIAAAALALTALLGIPQLPACGLFFACVACDNSFGRLLASKGAQVLGECSFGIYLLHGIVLDILFVELFPRWGNPSAAQMTWAMPAAGIAVVAVAATVYLAIERPGIRAGRWLAGTRAPRGRAEAAAIEIAP